MKITIEDSKLKTHLVSRYHCEIVRNGSCRYTTARKLNDSDTAKEFCEQVFADIAKAMQESFCIVMLDTQHKPIGIVEVTKGTLNASLVHPREVFKAAIIASASAILLVHNHPSGDTTPSKEDHAVTTRLQLVADIIGIQILDHIIIGFDDSIGSVVSHSLFGGA